MKGNANYNGFKTSFTIFIIFLFIFSTVLPSSFGLNIKKDSIMNTENKEINSKKWTWMLYDNSDFFNAGDPINLFTEWTYSSENVDIIVLQDIREDSAKLWYINEKDQEPSRILLDDIGEVNMGDGHTLEDFIQYCKENYPADMYMLSIYGFGSGWMGATPEFDLDEWITGNFDQLTMDEMQKALLNTNGVNILSFTAPCYMGAIESVYELRNCVDVYIGAESTSGWKWWTGIDKICDFLTQNPDIDVFSLGQEIILKIKEAHEGWGEPGDGYYQAIAAVRTDKINSLVDSIDLLSKYFLAHNEYYETIELFYDEIKDFDYSKDIYDFVDRLQNIEVISDELNMILDNIKIALQDAVYFKYIFDCENAHGLSIYLPRYIDHYVRGYADPNSEYGLDFTMDTTWDEFLDTFVKTKNKDKNSIIYPMTFNSNKLFSPNIIKIIYNLLFKI